MPREHHGQRSLAGYSPWGRKTVRHNWATKQKQTHELHSFGNTLKPIMVNFVAKNNLYQMPAICSPTLSGSQQLGRDTALFQTNTMCRFQSETEKSSSAFLYASFFASTTKTISESSKLCNFKMRESLSGWVPIEQTHIDVSYKWEINFVLWSHWDLGVGMLFKHNTAYPAEKAMAPHSSTLAWKIPWMEEPGRLPSMGSHRVRHDWSDLAAAVYPD